MVAVKDAAPSEQVTDGGCEAPPHLPPGRRRTGVSSPTQSRLTLLSKAVAVNPLKRENVYRKPRMDYKLPLFLVSTDTRQSCHIAKTASERFPRFLYWSVQNNNSNNKS